MKKLSNNNGYIIRQAQCRAAEMNTWPSPLEEKMKLFLDAHCIKYEQQKIIYIYNKEKIVRYYIVDFFIPETNVIIEVDGKFHDKHRQHDRDRTKAIQSVYPGIEVMRFKWKDLSDKKKMDELLSKVK